MFSSQTWNAYSHGKMDYTPCKHRRFDVSKVFTMNA